MKNLSYEQKCVLYELYYYGCGTLVDGNVLRTARSLQRKKLVSLSRHKKPRARVTQLGFYTCCQFIARLLPPPCWQMKVESVFHGK